MAHHDDKDAVASDSVQNETVEIKDVETTNDDQATHDEIVDSVEETEQKPAKKRRLISRLPKIPKPTLTKKRLLIIGAVLAVIAALGVVPVTRYAVAGTMIKRSFSASITDTKNNRPVSGAEVQIAGRTAQTDGNGNVTLTNIPVGSKRIKLSKRNYKNAEQTITVTIGKQIVAQKIQMEATGRQVPVTITNKISGKAIQSATIKTSDSDAKTDDKGQAVIVLPTTGDTQDATITSDGFNESKVTIAVSDQELPENKFTITPSGKVFFLSRKSGKIDVVKTNLDGTERETVLAGTGKEEDAGTVMLASRDWKYLALKSSRDGGNPKMFLIKTADDKKLTVMDEGNAVFDPIGWEGDTFAFTVKRNGLSNWTTKRESIKTYKADSDKLTTIDSTLAFGLASDDYVYESFGSVSLLETGMVYTKNWYKFGGPLLVGKHSTINTAKLSGDDKKILLELGEGNPSQYCYCYESMTIETKLYKPGEIYFADSTSDNIYEYEDGKVAKSEYVNRDKFYNDPYLTFLLSPSGKRLVWTDQRDGKNTFLTASEKLESPATVAELNAFSAYGWYSDEYILVTKNGSELYIMSKDGVSGEGGLTKVSDYHKPNQSFVGYGGGYGGF